MGYLSTCCETASVPQILHLGGDSVAQTELPRSDELLDGA